MHAGLQTVCMRRREKLDHAETSKCSQRWQDWAKPMDAWHVSAAGCAHHVMHCALPMTWVGMNEMKYGPHGGQPLPGLTAYDVR